ncbi:zinc-finger domain-containing protein [uncultured Cohaesibacter sp.]|uniref:zinc-finger domain-containing protein n=1 Tax=uncultured Cohaesibacter sp. TaxID=1002546 RepID=UPI0029C78B02|nr:zinc-finger domain-containing protein [uncultured Cohaesibacter sp.]
MAGSQIPHFKNDQGVPVISVGVREFQCIGATPPQDHPHIFLDMGKADEILCPYCSTLYKLDEDLGPQTTRPSGCYHEDSDQA